MKVTSIYFAFDAPLSFTLPQTKHKQPNSKSLDTPFTMSVARIAQPATPKAPATPAAQTEPTYTPNGTWRHPKFDEIARRQYATTFDESNVRRIVANAGLLFLSVYGNTVTSNVGPLSYAAQVFSNFAQSHANSNQNSHQRRCKSRAV